MERVNLMLRWSELFSTNYKIRAQTDNFVSFANIHRLRGEGIRQSTKQVRRYVQSSIWDITNAPSSKGTPLRFSRIMLFRTNRCKRQNGFVLFSACSTALFLLTLSVCSISAIIRRCLFLCLPRRKSPHKQLLLILQKRLLIIDGTTYGSAEQVYSLSHPSSPLRLVSFLQSPAHPLVPTVDNASETTFANVPSDTLDLVVLRVCSSIHSSFFLSLRLFFFNSYGLFVW